MIIVEWLILNSLLLFFPKDVERKRRRRAVSSSIASSYAVTPGEVSMQ